MSGYSRSLLAFPLIALCACKSYDAAPLIPEEVLREIRLARGLPAEVVSDPEFERSGPGLDELAGWMLRSSPILQVARANAAAAGALAETATPIPNPTLAAGPIFGDELPPGSSGSVVPLVEFGFSVPLTGRLGYQDEVNALLAEEARTEVIAAHRQALLKLRELHVVRVLTHRRLLVQEEVVDSTRRAAEITRRLVEAGTASALDVGLMELEISAAVDVQLGLRGREVQNDAELASLIGVHARHLGQPISATELPPPAVLPTLEVTEKIMLANHPGLARLRARYAVAEKQLRLEIAKQYPDLDIGTTYEGDPGTDISYLGLTLGINLPIFNRNQQAIVVAEQEREKIRTEYGATLSLALASLESLYERRTLLAERLQLLEEYALPHAESNVNIANQSIQAGEVDILRVLEVRRSLRLLRIEVLEAEEALRRLSAEIEQLIGWPLVALSPGGATEYPSYPGSPSSAATHSTDE